MKALIAIAGGAALVASMAAAAPDVVRESQEVTELRADWLIGTSVLTAGPEAQTVGSVEDLIVDEEGRVTAVVISIGGFLGVGAKSVALKWDDLEVDYDGSELRVDASSDAIEEAPEFAFRDQERRPPTPRATGTGTGTGIGTTTPPTPQD